MDKLQQIFKFLTQNRHWNAAFQMTEYQRALSHWENPKARINALLHMVAHTQSSPNLETLAKFWQHIEAAPWNSRPPSLIELTEYIEQKSQLVVINAEPWDRLFRALSNVAGWGPKTAALFVVNGTPELIQRLPASAL